MLFRRLLAMLHRARPRQPAGQTPHLPVSSYTRRYPGRTPAAELRRNLGWIAVSADRPHQDRRA
ncbi:MAG: hypothetical protein VW600_21260 [Ferrovibrio sp.]